VAPARPISHSGLAWRPVRRACRSALSPLAALVSAGLPTDSFTFAGFLPARRKARQKRLLQFASLHSTLIFFESPRRLKASLADFLACFGPRPAAIARELTKLHETVRTGSLAELCAHYEQVENIRGEIVVLVAGRTERPAAISRQDLRREIERQLQENSLRDAVAAVCARHDLPRSKVYNLALEIKNEESRGEREKGEAERE